MTFAAAVRTGEPAPAAPAQISQKPSRQRNAFGALRLLLASLVIIAHTPELMDGNPNREILHRITGNQDFGSLAVNGFFLLSGLLISSSYLNSASLTDYMKKRVARIYPAFAICSILSVLIVGPLAGGYHPYAFIRGMIDTISRVLTLRMPAMSGTFHDTPYPMLNGAAWTIKYEFTCYLLVIPLGMAGWLRSSGKLWTISALLLLIHSAVVNGAAGSVGIDPDSMVLKSLRLIGLFIAGAATRPCFDRMTFTRSRLILAALILSASLMSPITSTIGCATAGAYLLFGTGVLGGRTVFHRVNNDPDISYGLYLYGWPVEKVILWVFPTINIFAAGVVTWIIAAILGLASWLWVEKPVLDLARDRC